MKTSIPTDLIKPTLATDVVRNGSALQFIYSDGSSEEINLLTIGQAIIAAATVTANTKISQATYDFVLANPQANREGSIQTTGVAAFVYNNTLLQVSP